MSKTAVLHKDRKKSKGKTMSHGTFREKRKPNSPRVKSQQSDQE